MKLIWPEDRAERDIRDLYLYSAKHFGLKQAEQYLLGLQRRVDMLKRDPLIGTPVEGAKSRLRRLVYKQHVIYYRVSEAEVRILRILDARRDARRHLREP